MLHGQILIFELWLLAHLKRVDRYISKDKIIAELNKEFKKMDLESIERMMIKSLIRLLVMGR